MNKIKNPPCIVAACLLGAWEEFTPLPEAADRAKLEEIRVMIEDHQSMRGALPEGEEREEGEARTAGTPYIIEYWMVALETVNELNMPARTEELAAKIIDMLEDLEDQNAELMVPEDKNSHLARYIMISAVDP